ncbi:MAG: hypothetical protein ACYCSS_07690 [Sulfuriferula sp.]
MSSSNQQFGQSIRHGLVAGTIAIIINILLLQFGSVLGLHTGHGGLLKWLVTITHLGPIQWNRSPLNMLPASIWKIAFHFVVGLGMGLFYVILLEPKLRRIFTPLMSGLFYALALWLVNAWVILPGLGMGIAGEAAIPISGMLYFAFAHTAFFVILAVLYAKFTQRST